MRSIIVYYSLEGNTEYVVKEIAKRIGSDILKLKTIKEFPKGKVSKFFWGGKSVLFGEKPKLESYNFNSEDYDLIIFATPIWAGTFTPPIKTFLSENKIINKNVALVACSSGGDVNKCFNKFTEELRECNLLYTLSLIDPKVKQKDEDVNEIEKFCNRIIEEF